MRVRQSNLRVAAVVLTLWAALPALRWCPMGGTGAWPGCLYGAGFARPQAAPACVAPANASPGSEPARDRCASQADACRRGAAASRADACPLADRCAPPAPTRPDAATAAHARALCLGESNGGPAVRALGPRLRVEPAPSAVAFGGVAFLAPPPRAFARLAPQLAARPPTAPRALLPPVRGPPAA